MLAVIRAALLKEPLEEKPGPLGALVFDLLTAPSPLALALLLVGGLVAAGLAFARSSIPTDLFVESEPSGATVVVDGRERGTTPMTVRNLSRGTHAIELRLAGHEPRKLEAEVAPFAVASYALQLSPVIERPALAQREKEEDISDLFAPEKGKARAPAKRPMRGAGAR